jgi:large subunit ribosomal protein L21
MKPPNFVELKEQKMYSIVEIGGHQYKVQAGDLIDVQKLDQAEGSDVTFDKVLFVGGDKTEVGAPVVAGATVTARVVRQGRSRKVIVFKRKPGLYKKKNGHRQPYTGLLITEIKTGSGSASIDKNSDLAKKFLK